MSWQIFKLLGSGDTLTVLPYVPAAISMKKLLTISKKRGVDGSRLSEAETAFSAFEDFVRVSAGDRERLETMLLSTTDSAEAVQADLQHRKAAFKAFSHFFGIEVDTYAYALIHNPGSIKNTVDCAALLTLSGMRRLRLDTDVVVARMQMTDDSGNTAGGPSSIIPSGLIDPDAAAQYGAPVLPAFCSQPVPPLETIVDPSGRTRTLLRSQQVGSGADMDLAFGRVFRDLPMKFDAAGDPFASSVVETSRPTRLMVADFLVHRDAFVVTESHSSLYGQAAAATTVEQIEREGIRLPLRDHFEHVGRGEDAARLRELPRYTEFLRSACDTLGYDLAQMEVYRIRLEYPLMDSRLVLKFRIGR